jgi:putative ABC transport system permease protein
MLLQDLRYAARTVARNRGFTAVAVLCLAFGIGVNSTIFSVVNGVILRPYPYADPDRIVVLDSTNKRLDVREGLISYPDFKDLRDQSKTLLSVAAFGGRSLTISDNTSEPERYLGSMVSWNLFELLGTPPILGRNFTPEDDRLGAEPVVLLSYEIWQRRYGGDPAIVGRAVSINTRPHTVVGVMPPRFGFPEISRLWVPLAFYAESWSRDDRSLEMFARLKPGTTIGQAATDLEALAARLATTYPDANRDWTVRVRPLSDWMLPDDVRLIVLTMMGAATLVLLIACANVANLLLARASVRHREISIRAALGAGRWRIMRQLLTEAIIIGLLSAPLGIVIAVVGLRLLDRSIPLDSIPYFIHWSMDWQSIAYTIAISMVTGVAFGLVPSLQAAQGNLQDSLKEGARGATGGRRAWMRNVLVVAEVSLALVLLVGASLFVRSFRNLQHANVGFDTAPLMTLRFYLTGEVYDAADAKSRRVEDIVRRVETLPGVEAAFASNFVPLGNGGGGGPVIIEGRPQNDPTGRQPSILRVAASPHLRQTLGVALVRGRDFTDAEGNSKTPVALVNQTMAARFWGDVDPLGRRFRLASGDSTEWFTVIGVLADFRHSQRPSDNRVSPAAYVPYPYEPTLNTGLTIRVSSDPAHITQAAREQIRQSDASLPIFQVRTMEENRQRSYWQYAIFGWMFSIFGFIALALASIGVYGVLSYAVSQRTQEIGVRVALGAHRRDVLRLIIGQGLKLAAVGVVVGLAGAFAVTPVIRTLLYNVTPSDPLSFASVSTFLVAVAAVASYVPARRALRVDPIIALRGE